ncbi:hypothetical protein M885DRAFT_613182 [Pelagophyceae sp. CCMP2097]|nr:hypothetical protein M885DRAFT_613182 [Pelagophyceae sp. CCMP2097]
MVFWKLFALPLCVRWFLHAAGSRRDAAKQPVKRLCAAHPMHATAAALLCGIRNGDTGAPVQLAGDASVRELAPVPFGALRRAWRCDGALRRACRGAPREALLEQCGGGSRGAARRGNVFFETRRGRRFVLKQETKSNADQLRRIAEDYKRYVVEHPDSLLPRFVGVFEAVVAGETTYWLVMNNVFTVPRGAVVEARYDLKGSTSGRAAKHPTSTQKDLDALRDKASLVSRRRDVNALVATVDADSAFLEKHGLLDYSLLVGVVKRRPSLIPAGAAIRDRIFARRAPRRGVRVLPVAKTWTPCDALRRRTFLVVGLVDILQPFDYLKKLEYACRGALRGFGAISAVPPATYRKRLVDFVQNLFLEDDADPKLDPATV